MKIHKLLIKLIIAMTSSIVAAIFTTGLYISALLYMDNVTEWSGNSRIWFTLVGSMGTSNTSLHLSGWIITTIILFIVSITLFISCIYDYKK